MSMYHMVESTWIIKRIIDVFETDFIPQLYYKGPLYLSKYGLYVDPIKDRTGNRNLEKIQMLVDGQRSCMDIAAILDLDFYFVRDFLMKLKEKDLAKIKKYRRKDFDVF